jgi:hypothetical protein
MVPQEGRDLRHRRQARERLALCRYFAVVKYGELSPDYVRLVLKQLGIPRHEI